MSDYTFAPDPEAMGRIKRVVETAHKWGGDGNKPMFRKIRQVLIAKHPEVIAKAFGGNANVAAAWIKNNWYRMRGRKVPPTRGEHAMSMSLYREVPSDFFGEDSAEMFLRADSSTESGVVWVTALRTGAWKVNPVAGAKGPLKIDKDFLDEVLSAYHDGAWEHVTVPTYHTDNDPLANTGFVRDLKVVPDTQRKGEWVLRAAIEFTEPAVAERVSRGSIAGVSVNVKFNITHQETGKTYSKVLTHIALTNIPFINGLKSFDKKLAANYDDEIIASYTLEDDDVAFTHFLEDLMAAKTLFDAERDFDYVRAQVSAHLAKGYFFTSDGDVVDRSGRNVEGEVVGLDANVDLSPAYLYIKGINPEQVLICGHSASGGSESVADYSETQDANHTLCGWVAGYEITEDGEVVLDAIDEWTAVEKTWVALSKEWSLLKTYGTESEVTMNQGEDLGSLSLASANDLEGGDKMANVNEEVTQETEGSLEGTLTLSREDLDQLIAERTEAALTAMREEQANAEAELAATRRRLHEMEVADKIAELNAQHAPAVVKIAQEIMLADTRKEAVLSLTRESGEVALSATDIVTELLASIPETALKNDAVDPLNLTNAPDDSKSRADALYEQLYGNGAQAVTLS